MLDSFRKESIKRHERRAARLNALRLIEEAVSSSNKRIDRHDMSGETASTCLCDSRDGAIDYADSVLKSTSMDDLETVGSSTFDDDIDSENCVDAPQISITRSRNNEDDDSLGLQEVRIIPLVECDTSGSVRDEPRDGWKVKPLPRTTFPFLVGFISGIIIMTSILVAEGNPPMKLSLLRHHGGGQPLPPSIDLADFCDMCHWKNSLFNCKQRVAWEMVHYNMTETDAKRANLEYCTTLDGEGAEPGS